MTATPYRRIESEDNAFFKGLRKTLTGRGIRKYGSALISGERAVGDFVRLAPELCEAWITTDGQPGPPVGLPDRVPWYQLARQLFRSVDVSGTHSPLLLATTPPIPRWDPGAGLAEGCTLLLPFQDPENVGTAIRSAVAFGVRTVVLLAECAHPFHPRSVRASAGAVFHAALFRGPALADLPSDLPVIALSPDGADIAEAAFPDVFALLPGIEGPGLPAHLRANALAIPVAPEVESLNAAAATAIAMYLWVNSVNRNK